MVVWVGGKKLTFEDWTYLQVSVVYYCYLWQGLSSVDGKIHWLRKVIWRDQALQIGEEGRPKDYLTSDFDTKSM